MSEISEQEIHEYVATGEPTDKAGAYAIQGRASRWIPRIDGDYCNVVGLPVALVYQNAYWQLKGQAESYCSARIFSLLHFSALPLSQPI